MSKIKINYFADDGYVGGRGRPLTTEVDVDDLKACETREEQEELVYDAVQDHFEQRVSACLITKLDDVLPEPRGDADDSD